MLHFLPETEFEPRSEPYAEAVARLASIRHALRLVDPFGGGPASDPSDDERIAASWPAAPAARRKVFDTRSTRVAGSAAAGIEALLDERSLGHRPHQAASAAMVEEIRLGLEDLSKLMLRD